MGAEIGLSASSLIYFAPFVIVDYLRKMAEAIALSKNKNLEFVETAAKFLTCCDMNDQINNSLIPACNKHNISETPN